jgi:Domain of unknown function (DUF4169)
MGTIVNLKRARKAKDRAAAEGTAAANRVRYGTPKPTRDLTKAQSEKSAQALDSHLLDREKTPRE